MSTDIETITGRCETHMSAPLVPTIYRPARIHLTRFYGGAENGQMIQLTVQDSETVSHIQLTRDQVKKLAQILNDSFNSNIYPSE